MPAKAGIGSHRPVFTDFGFRRNDIGHERTDLAGRRMRGGFRFGADALAVPWPG